MQSWEYAEALKGEGEYWDNFIAQRLLRGEIPGSVDWRLAFTQFRHDYDWGPFCLGPKGINFRMREIHYVLTTATRRAGARVLDLGCGAGWLSLELARRGAHVTALDISPTNLAIGRHMAQTNARNFPYLYQHFAGLPCTLEQFGSVQYEYADLNDVELPGAEYDAVVVWDSLHHISNLEGLLEQVRRSLKPSGIFVGVDHAVATADTWTFSDTLLEQIDALCRWVSTTNPDWLYVGVTSLASKVDWGVMGVDYDDTPVPGFKPFLDTLRHELLGIIQEGMAVEKAADADQAPDEQEESPFEDVSNERLMRTLLDSFKVVRFQTINPFIEPESHFPSPRNEDERIFQNYVAAMALLAGDQAIACGRADGQWFVFHMTPEPPDDTAQSEGLQRIKKNISVSAYNRLLEAELEHKNAAIADLEARLRQREAELVEARKPQLPWKRGR